MHILYTVCAKIKKKKSGAKGLRAVKQVMMNLIITVKVKLEQATKTQRGSRGIPLLFP